jgi:hypothetical protein
MNQPERFCDVISEFNGQRRNLYLEKFLEQLDRYFQYGYFHDGQRIDIFQRRLSGHANVWLESLMPFPNTYDELKVLFRQQFWSAATQRKIRNEIFCPYQYRTSHGIATHAMGWIAKAKYLGPAIDAYDLIGVIIQHYPCTLDMTITCRSPRSTHELLAILTEFEEFTSFCEKVSNRQSENTPEPFGVYNYRGRYHNGRRPPFVDHDQRNYTRNGYDHKLLTFIY